MVMNAILCIWLFCTLKKKTFKPKAYAALLYPLALLFPPIFNLGNSGCLSLSKI